MCTSIKYVRVETHSKFLIPKDESYNKGDFEKLRIIKQNCNG